MAKLKPYDWNKIKVLYETGMRWSEIADHMKKDGHRHNIQYMRNHAHRYSWDREQIIRDRIRIRNENKEARAKVKDATVEAAALDRIRAINDEAGLRTRQVDLAEKQSAVCAELIVRSLAGIRQILALDESRRNLKDLDDISPAKNRLLKTLADIIDKAMKNQQAAGRWETIAAAIGEDNADESRLTQTEIAVNIANIFSSAGFDVVDETIVIPIDQDKED